LAIVTVLLNLK